MRHLLAVIPLVVITTAGFTLQAEPDEATCSEQLLGAWTGVLDTDTLFEFSTTVSGSESDAWTARILAGGTVEVVPVVRGGDRVGFRSVKYPISFDGRLQEDGLALGGFFYYGSWLTHAEFESGSDSTWTAAWNILGSSVGAQRFDLYVERENDLVSGGYYFFRDQRLPMLYGLGITCPEGRIILKEKNLDLRFEGHYDAGQDVMDLIVTGLGGSVPMVFRRMTDAEANDVAGSPLRPPRAQSESGGLQPPASIGDGWLTSRLEDEGLNRAPMDDLNRAILEGELDHTHAVLVARGGRLVFEEYFYGFDERLTHDMRSASKSVTSTLVGLAIDAGTIPGADERALSFFPQIRHPANWDERKAQISLRHLLTMSSGLDANDSDQNSMASEGRYQSQRQESDWMRLAWDAPMIDDPGNQPLYGGANPMILGGVLDQAVDEPVEWFAHKALFEPLGISSYKWFLDPLGRLYMGGGLHLRPRDMLKYGQMYLNGGTWNGRRVLSEEWIDASWQQYGRLAPLDRNGHQYGFLWWHHQYEVGDRVIKTVEARGYGGQYIFVIPELDMVVVTVGGNFRNGRTRQPEEILRRYVLPAAVP